MVCPTGCATCSSLSLCLTCSSSPTPYFLRADNFCYLSCLPGFYAENTNSTCVGCPTGCTTCSSLTNCLTCAFSPTSYFLRLDNLCYTSCLGGYYAETNNNTCVSCPTGCATCSSLSLCLTCASFPTSYFLRLNNLCYITCLAGFYAETANLTCVNCPTGCATCSSLTLCLTCSSTPTPYFLRTDHFCYTSCLPGFYAEATNGTCMTCPTGCATCSSSTICQTCSPSYFLHINSFCYLICTSLYVFNPSSLRC